jgi:hypothetical protein
MSWTTGVRFPVGAPSPDRLWGPPSLLSNGYLGIFLRDLGGRGVKLTTHLHLVPKLRIRGAIPPLHHTSSWRGDASYVLLPGTRQLGRPERIWKDKGVHTRYERFYDISHQRKDMGMKTKLSWVDYMFKILYSQSYKCWVRASSVSRQVSHLDLSSVHTWLTKSNVTEVTSARIRSISASKAVAIGGMYTAFVMRLRGPVNGTAK